MKRKAEQKAEGIASLKKRIREAEELIRIISRGKYQWQATFDAISDPVMIITKDFKIIRANIAFAKAVGKDIKEVIGKKCHHLFAKQKSHCRNCPAPASVQKKAVRSGRFDNNTGGREYVVNAFPFMDEVDKAEAIVVHYRDVTEERLLQQELIQQEKMAAIGMLAGGVAHEINNPLGGIIAFAQLIKRDIDEMLPLYGDIEEIERAAMRCKKIVQDLLDFSRLSSGKKKQWLDVNPLIEKVIPFIKTELKSLNIDLVTNFRTVLPRIYGDANRLEQVFLNLLTNACHSMSKGGTLGIRTFMPVGKDAVCVEIEDSGCGIPKEDLPKIFDPFFTTKRPGEGTGLGLSISYRIVRDHHGWIAVRSEKGRGSAFTVYLPTVLEDNTGGET